MTTAEWVRKLRIENKMSQQELALRAGLSFSFVNQVERGKQTMRLDALNQLLAVFNYTMSPTQVLKPASIQPQQIIEESSPPPVTIHRPKNDWSFFD